MQCETVHAALNDNPWFAVGPHRCYRRQLEKGNDLTAYDDIDWLRRSMIVSAASDTATHSPAAFMQSLGWNVMEVLRHAKRHYARLTWRQSRFDLAAENDAHSP